MDATEELLIYSRNGREVWRVGDTVRRPTGPQTPAVHALLRHLELVGFDGAPRVLGIDERDREVLTYVEGEAGWNGPYDDHTLTEVARTIRRFHDAVRSFQPPPGSVWNPNHGPGGPQLDGIVCHNDLAPYNTIYAPGRPPAFIDWDLASPAPYTWDLTYAAWRFVPLFTDADCARIGTPVRPRGERLRMFCDAYGLEGRDRAEFLDLLRVRLLAQDVAFARHSLELLDASWPDWERALV